MLETSVGKIMDKVFMWYKDNIAFKFGRKSITYGEVGLYSNKLANGLASLGLRKGDRVIIMTKNCIEYMYAMFATAKIGLVKVPLNTLLSIRDIDYRIKDSEAI